LWFHVEVGLQVCRFTFHDSRLTIHDCRLPEKTSGR